jgi:S-adenosylmethionine decarboxylase
MFFEGSEKKIEVIFSSQVESLRLQPRAFWEKLVNKAQAQILSEVSNEKMTAYLLSESSLFIYDHYLVMITCGTTQLVKAVDELMQHYQPQQIDAFFYERKNELLPQAQSTDFFKDVEILRQWFDGEALRYGREDEHHLYLFAAKKDYEPLANDHTMEILMHGIAPEISALFRNCQDCNSQELRDRSGLSDLVLGEVDDFVFDPMGYSLNAIYENRYFTIHITPESDGSYVSFETNAFDSAAQMEWAQKVLSVFKPLSFDLVLFNKDKVMQPDFANFRLKQQYAESLYSGYQTQYFSYYSPNPNEQKPTRLLGGPDESE